MRKLFTIFAVVLSTAGVFAQAPEKMSYQAVIRDASDNLVTSQSIGMQISILHSNADGTAIYIERHYPTTNINGLVNIEIGDGTVVSGIFSSIDWSDGLYFIKSETDLNGGANYTITGTSQLLSVPYALYAKSAETVTGEINETYEVGDFAHGGVVFYVEPCGTKGLVAAIEDQNGGSPIKWRGGSTYYSTMAKGDEIYAGKMNTSIIISVHSAKDDFDNHAALVCANYEGGGFGDWYLPSREESTLMYENKDAIDDTAIANGGSAFDSLYWSSSENNYRYAYVHYFTNPVSVETFKAESHHVRAIRAF